MSQARLHEAVALDCLRHGATLSKAYLNIALLPSICNPNPHFYPWKLGGGGGGRWGGQGEVGFS